MIEENPFYECVMFSHYCIEYNFTPKWRWLKREMEKYKTKK
jgi:hypothetical protein